MGELPISTLISTLGKRTSIFHHLHSSLISLGQLCDDNCIVILGKELLEVIKEGKVVLRGPQSTSGDGLWDIPLPQKPHPTPTLLNISTPQQSPVTIKPTPRYPAPQKQTINVIIRKDKTHQDLATYLHAAAFSPTHRTFIEAIKRKFFVTWPGLTTALIKNHLPPSVNTAKGHLNQEKSGLQSTKDRIIQEDFYPLADEPNIKTNDVIYSIVSSSDRAFLDLPGRFPHCSSRGNQYIVVAYHYDANAIVGLPIKNRQAGTITAAWKSLHNKFQKAGVSPRV